MQMPSNGRPATTRVDSARSSGSRPPWMMPKIAWSGRVWASRDRAAQTLERAVASARAVRAVEAGGTGWSKATAMSEPSASCTSIDNSGVKRW